MRQWAIAAALLAGLGSAAQADTFDKGALDGGAIGATGFSLTNEAGVLGAFTDVFTFTIAEGDWFSMDAHVQVGPSRRTWIDDLDGQLFAGSNLLADAPGVSTSTPEGFPIRTVDFPPLILGAGDYRLTLTGTGGVAFPDTTMRAGYDGLANFTAVAAPIPEPETWALMGAGLLGVAVLARRRRAPAT